MLTWGDVPPGSLLLGAVCGSQIDRCGSSSWQARTLTVPIMQVSSTSLVEHYTPPDRIQWRVPSALLPAVVLLHPTGGCSALLKPDCWDPSPISTVDLLVPRLYTHVGHRTCYALARVRKISLALIITPGGTSSTSQPFDSNDDFGFSPDMDHQAENIQITIKFRFHCFITFVRFV